MAKAEQAAFQAAVEQTTHPLRTDSSGFVFAGIPRRSLRDSSRIGNGGLKGRLQARLPAARNGKSPESSAARPAGGYFSGLRVPQPSCSKADENSSRKRAPAKSRQQPAVLRTRPKSPGASSVRLDKLNHVPPNKNLGSQRDLAGQKCRHYFMAQRAISRNRWVRWPPSPKISARIAATFCRKSSLTVQINQIHGSFESRPPRNFCRFAPPPLKS